MRDQCVGEDYWDEENGEFPPGMKNPTADRVPRKDMELTGASNLARDFDHLRALPQLANLTFDRLKCRACGGTLFEVLHTDSYETAARCLCGYYYVVHSG
jgi:hypothetical protein